MPVYAALYRAWRPKRLADVIGQEHVTRTLRNALRQGHTAHAYLFCGPRGTGKTSTARILAAALNCEHPEDGDACGECERCREVAADRLVDVQEIDAASHRQVEDIRALRDTVAYAPAAGRHKVYILDEVHMLTDASWNTLLKTLEEPPPATSFVLCTTDPRKVLATVVSRCQRFDFRRLGIDEIVARLQVVCRAEDIAASAGALTAIARRSDGGLRDALSILDQATAYASEAEISATDIARIVGAADEETVERLLDAAERGDAQAALLEVEGLYADGRDMAQVARDLLAVLRDRLGTLADPTSGDRARLGWHMRTIQTLAEAEGTMRRWSQPRLVLEIALLQSCGEAGSGPRGREPASGRAPDAEAPRPIQVPPTPRRSNAAPEAPPQPANGRPASPPRPGAAPPANHDGDAEAQVAPASREPAPDMKTTWAAILQGIGAEHPAKRVGLTEAVPLGIVGGALRISVPDGLLQIADTRRALVEQMWQRVTGAPIRVEFVARASASRQSDARGPARAAASVSPSRRPQPVAEDADPPPPGEPPPPVDAEGPGEGGQNRVGGETRPVGEAAPRRPGAEAAFRKALALFEGTALE